MNIQDWFPLGWTGRISLQSKGLSGVFFNTTASILQCSAFFIVQFSHPYMTTGKTIALTRWTFVGKVMPLFLNMLSRLVIAFLPRSKHLLISWLQSPSAVILEPRKIKSLTVSTVSPSICHEVMGPSIRWWCKCIYMHRQYKWNDRWTYLYSQQKQTRFIDLRLMYMQQHAYSYIEFFCSHLFFHATVTC